MSYYDTNIGVHNIVYTGIEPTDNYDNIYQSDLCGWVGQIGYGEDTAWFANAYKTKTKEELAAAGFYATGLAQSIKSMQPEICRTGTVQEKKNFIRII